MDEKVADSEIRSSNLAKERDEAQRELVVAREKASQLENDWAAAAKKNKARRLELEEKVKSAHELAGEKDEAARAANEANAVRVENMQKEHSQQIHNLESNHTEAIADLKQCLEEGVKSSEMDILKDKHSKDISELKSHHETAVIQLEESLKREHVERAAIMESDHETLVAALKAEMEVKRSELVESVESSHASAVLNLEVTLQSEHSELIAEVEGKHESAMEALEKSLTQGHQASIDAIHEEHSKTAANLQADHARALSEMSDNFAAMNAMNDAVHQDAKGAAMRDLERREAELAEKHAVAITVAEEAVEANLSSTLTQKHEEEATALRTEMETAATHEREASNIAFVKVQNLLLEEEREHKEAIRRADDAEAKLQEAREDLKMLKELSYKAGKQKTTPKEEASGAGEPPVVRDEPPSRMYVYLKKMEVSDGIIIMYSGFVDDKGLPNGKGVATYMNNASYEGMFDHGVWHGPGVSDLNLFAHVTPGRYLFCVRARRCNYKYRYSRMAAVRPTSGFTSKAIQLRKVLAGAQTEKKHGKW